MNNEVIRTGVDELLDFLTHNDKTALSEVASKLKIDVNTLQAWVDFLVEESIVGIEYKFTTPYIYLNKSLEKKKEESMGENDKN